MQQSGRLLTGFEVSAKALTLTHGVLRAMLWIRLRFLTVAALTVVIACGGATIYVRGSHTPGQQNAPAASTPPAAETPQPKTSKNAKELDAPATRRESLRAQQFAVQKAKALYEIARLNRELAEIAVEEYESLKYPSALAKIEAELEQAETDLTHITQVEKTTGALTIQKAKFVREMARSKRHVLVEFTKMKEVKNLKSEVEKARSDELAKEATWQLEQAKEHKLERDLGLKAK